MMKKTIGLVQYKILPLVLLLLLLLTNVPQPATSTTSASKSTGNSNSNCSPRNRSAFFQKNPTSTLTLPLAFVNTNNTRNQKSSTQQSMRLNPHEQQPHQHQRQSSRAKRRQQQRQQQQQQQQRTNQLQVRAHMKDHLGDAAAFNQFISKAVDITQVNERNGILTLTRSCRDVDSNKRKKYIYYYNLISLASASKLGRSLRESHSGVGVAVGSRTSSTLPSGDELMMMMMPPLELPSNVKARIVSPSGKKIAIFKEEEGSNKTKKQIVEIWTNEGMTLSKRVILPLNKLHGSVCFDTSWFGSISWNNDETALVYSAEMKPPTTKSYFDLDTSGSTSAKKSNNDDDDDNLIVGGTNTLHYGKGEDWGEKYTSTCRLSLYILNVYTGNIGAVKNVPGMDPTMSTSTEGGFTLGQAIFSPCGNFIVYTGWDAGGGGEVPRRLGSIYCYQRPCKIYASPVDRLLVELGSSSDTGDDDSTVIDVEVEQGNFLCITPIDRLARSPRFCVSSKTGINKLIYLCNTEGFDTHGGAMALHAVDWDNDNGARLKSKRVLVHVVELPHFGIDGPDDENTSSVLGMSFPGLFLNQLPENSFLRDGLSILVTTQWGSITKIVKISLVDGSIKTINFNLAVAEQESDTSDSSQTLLCLTSNGDAVVSQSEPNRPPMIGIIPSSFLTDDDTKVQQSLLLPPLPCVTATAKFDSFRSTVTGSSTTHLVSITPNHGEVKSVVQGILLLPTNEDGVEEENIPLIVVPHGGPHSCTTLSYTPSYAYLCEHGKYAILHVNYRGSAGFGQAPLESLAGNIGSQDIDDVYQLTRRVLDSFTGINPSRVGICGGSHGGFLAGHAIGQNPELFKVAAMRNPVCNVATMVTPTDIPDWCYVEALGPGNYDWNTYKGPTPDELTKMWEASPMAHIDNVVSPTLLAIGKSDKRVPPSQGIEYYHALRSKGVKTKLLLYDDDDHAIDKVQSEADHWINIKQWFDEHI